MADTVSKAERSALYDGVVRELEQLQFPRARVCPGRKPTEDDTIYAAWANLALERPEVTLAEVRRILKETDE